jgi:hypothetical protein
MLWSAHGPGPVVHLHRGSKSAVLIRSLKESLYKLSCAVFYAGISRTCAHCGHWHCSDQSCQADLGGCESDLWRLRIDQVPFMGSVLFVLFVLFVDLACR